MRPRYCSECGSPVAQPGDRARNRPVMVVCPECGHRSGLRPACLVAGILTRDGDLGPEVLLVRRRPSASHEGRSYALPGKQIEWGEDARVEVLRAFWELTGLKVVVNSVYDVHSNFHDPEHQTVGSWFRVQEKAGASQRLMAGADADEVGFFRIDRLPELAFPTDELVLERLAKDYHSTGELAAPDLSAQLQRRKRKYRELLEAYTNELMRTAWINDLHLHLSKEESTAEIAHVATRHLAAWPEVDEVAIWYAGPPDRCGGCRWRERCPQSECLHLIAAAQSELLGGLPEGERGGEPYAPEAQDRLPLILGVPAADVALQNAPQRAEIPGAGAQPRRFEGFPLEATSRSMPGVLGLFARTPLDPNARRLFEVVSHHLGTLVRNARLVDDLRRANEVKLGFISRLSHELKTPLTAILGYAELLREALLAEGHEMGADGAATIEESGRKLLEIVESILEFAKLQNGAIRLRPTQLDLGELVKERVHDHRARVEILGKKVPIRLHRASESFSVTADARRTRQLLDELLGNAVKFTETGQIDVTISQVDGEVVCEIQDTGIGIPPELHDAIFDAFHQASEKIHLDYGGLGIGLTVAKLLAEGQGGRIWLDSQAGAGTRVSFALPRIAT